MKVFVPGQRWVSETEPELGLGMVLNTTPNQVTVVFRATGTTRQYSIENAPLKRVLFRAGETIQGGEEEKKFKVSEVTEERGLIIYHSEGTQIPETLLSDKMSLNAPRERLLAGHVSPSSTFDLRTRAIQLHHEIRRSPVRGFVGGRIGLIPHQLFIASEVTSRQNPRVLLADEVGLGKTIESCLILHRLLLTGRVQRVLILLPESLVHQWFVELLRRFNLWFSIFDEERCAAIEQHDPEGNPFQENQLIIASIKLLSQKESRATQALSAGWDLLIVDEAHHLHWSPEAPSAEYQIVEALARSTPAMLLLTATPEQLGEASHFARLRLLDPERFHDLEHFLAEHSHYEEIATVAGKLLAGEKLSSAESAALGAVLGIAAEPLSAQLLSAPGDVVKRLLDQHGTGRVMFRNTRVAMSGFPKRMANLISLPPVNTERLGELHEEFETDADPAAPKPPYDFDDDARISWLANFLRNNPGAKVLLLCRYREKVEMIEGALRGAIKVNIAVFHEKLPLIQRDRNAAWFAEEEGAQILICSEIGSEGRNFQFSHHLVLFDLPLDPELLEQRIGRLDRIGQTNEIMIHIPFIQGSPQELLVRWYQEGVNAFVRHFSGGAEMGEAFRAEVFRIALEDAPQEEFETLLKKTQRFRVQLEEKLHLGRDRLLEMNSFDAKRSAVIIEQIALLDSDAKLERFVTEAFDHFGLRIDDLGNRTFSLGGGDLFHDKIPALPEEGLTATVDRTRALSRENVGFLTLDHPIVTSLLDMLLGSEQGNSAFALWPGAPEGGVIVETIYILEAQAPANLQLDRFLPPTPLRIVLNHKRKELGAEASPEVLSTGLKNGDPAIFAAQLQEFGTLMPGMLR
ncbi:MAG TPA: RNA polymerase-associated protein RapA, partial [Verrucomicrobiae bacterium]|nr:RNA polymerase-associated protein RapA [Verrucomicrobiae bacterium]